MLGVGTIVAVLLGADGILLAVGIALLFAAVLLLGPVMAKPISRLLGAPVQRWRGITGAMARGNVQRNPKRTARTAAPVLDRRGAGRPELRSSPHPSRSSSATRSGRPSSATT